MDDALRVDAAAVFCVRESLPPNHVVGASAATIEEEDSRGREALLHLQSDDVHLQVLVIES